MLTQGSFRGMALRDVPYAHLLALRRACEAKAAETPGGIFAATGQRGRQGTRQGTPQDTRRATRQGTCQGVLGKRQRPVQTDGQRSATHDSSTSCECLPCSCSRIRFSPRPSVRMVDFFRHGNETVLKAAAPNRPSPLTSADSRHSSLDRRIQEIQKEWDAAEKERDFTRNGASTVPWRRLAQAISHWG